MSRFRQSVSRQDSVFVTAGAKSAAKRPRSMHGQGCDDENFENGSIAASATRNELQP